MPRLLRLCMVLPHATGAPVFSMNTLLNCQYVQLAFFKFQSFNPPNKSRWQNNRLDSAEQPRYIYSQLGLGSGSTEVPEAGGLNLLFRVYRI